MRYRTSTLFALPVVIALLAGISAAGPPDDLESRTRAVRQAEVEQMEFDVADLYLELNHTDGDLGIHGLIDGEDWKQIDILSPDSRRQLRINARGALRGHGVTELFFESAEPSFTDLLPEEFFDLFPEGEWRITGTTIEGDRLESGTLLRHVLAAPPGNVMVGGMTAAESCDVDPLPVVTAPVTISWDAVTSSHPTIGNTGPIQVVRYQLVMEREEPTSLVISVDLPPDVTSFEIPDDFTDLGEEYKFEIIVREASGNQTAVESCFELADAE
jgi:hypothetical protein